MSDRSLVSVVRRWWYVLVLCPIVAGMLGFAIVQRIPSVYEANETVSIQPITGADGVPDVQAAQGLADSYAEQIHTTPVLTAAAASVGLPSAPSNELSAMVQARRLTNTSLVRVTVQGTDPTQAAQFANAIVTTFISQNAQDEVSRYTAIQNNLVGIVTQLQNDQASRNQQIDALRAQAASPDRDTQIARLQDQVTQLQASQGVAARSLQDLQLASARSGSTLTVVDPAAPPNAPVRPNRALSVLMAMLAGLLAGVGLVWLLETMDDRLRDAPSVARLLQLPTLARIPQTDAGLSISGPQDARVEARFGELRSNVLASLRAVEPDEHAPVFAIASASDGDGKSVVAANLAVALARTGRKVTLVDADLAHPAQAAEFNLRNDSGFADLLSGHQHDVASCLQPSGVENLLVLPAGVATSGTDASALLLSQRLAALMEELQRGCDVLLVDTPGLVERSEGAWLSARADAVVLVVDARHASKRTIEPALAVLHDAGARLLGVVLNRVPSEPDAHASRSEPRPVPAPPTQAATVPAPAAQTATVPASAAQAATSAGTSGARSTPRPVASRRRVSSG